MTRLSTIDGGFLLTESQNSPSTGLNVTCCNYAGTVYFGLIAGRTAVPDLPLLTAYLDKAFGCLAEATGVAGSRRKSA